MVGNLVLWRRVSLAVVIYSDCITEAIPLQRKIIINNYIDLNSVAIKIIIKKRVF